MSNCGGIVYPKFLPVSVGMHAPMGNEIFEVSQKMNFLTQDPLPRQIAGMGGRKGLGPLCELLGIADRRTAIRDQINRGVVASDYQSKLARQFGFRLDWAEWNDPDPFKDIPDKARRDTCEAFKKRYIKEKTAGAGGLPDFSGQTALQFQRSNGLDALNPEFASLELSADQRGPGEPRPVGVQLVCAPHFFDFVELTIKRGILSFDCPDGAPGDIAERTAFLNDPDLKRNPASISILAYGPDHGPVFEIIVDPAPAAPWYVLGNLCLLHEPAAGHAVSAWFKVYVKDIERLAARDGHETSLSSERNTRSFKLCDFEDLSAAKQKILEMLAARRITGNGDYAVLCSDTGQFVLPEDGQGETCE